MEKLVQAQLQTNELTVYQQIALEGEVAAIMYNCGSEKEKSYYAFLKLALCDDRHLLVYKNEFMKYMDEYVINTLIGYRYTGIVPSYLFAAHYITEIRSMLGNSCGALRIAEQPVAVVKSRFANAMREMANFIPTQVDAILNEIININNGELDFMTSMVFALKQSLEFGPMEQQIAYDAKIKLLSQPLDKIPMLNFAMEEERIKQQSSMPSMASKFDSNCLKDIVGLVSDMVNNLANEDIMSGASTDTDEKLVYVVKKIDKANNQVVFTKEFDTQKQATEFVKDIIKSYPEIGRRFNFTVELVEV